MPDGKATLVIRSSTAAVGLAINRQQRRLGQRIGRAIEHDAAGGHADDPAAIRTCRVQGMQIADHRYAIPPIEIGQCIHHQLRIDRIK